MAEDARLCVEMAVAMQQRVQALQDEWKNAGYTKAFNIRVGIHTGYCTVGNFGTESRMDYTIVGSSVNLASRIESSAAPGSIHISEDTYLLVRDHFHCLPANSLVPKGFTQPVQLYRVLTESERATVRSVDLEGFHLDYDPARLDAEQQASLQTLLDKLKRKLS